MIKSIQFIGAGLILLMILSGSIWADSYFETLQSDQQINGFTVKNLYTNSTDDAMGARFISDRYGFVLDVYHIESVPQAYFWIKTVPTSSMGEPHACEHLLLGKGNRGRYARALEDMTLSKSTALTHQMITTYDFNTIAGEDTFYKIFEAKLDAFVNPDFTDEEIRREVCHIGVTENPQDGSLQVEEKGTVYTEMVSAYEKPVYHWYFALRELVYGADHPAACVQGGIPAEMRKMVPADMWKFHKETHHLANMGAIVSIPESIEIEDLLEKMSGILAKCQKTPTTSTYYGISNRDLPSEKGAARGETRIVTYPSDKTEDPGYMALAWPADIKLSPRELFLLDVFQDAFANGETSILYDSFINSQKRKIDIGGNYIWGDYSDITDVSVEYGLNGIDNKYATKDMLDSVKTLITTEIEAIYNYPDGSADLNTFNDKIKGRLIENKKETDNYLNSPPMFGFRIGPSGGWLNILESLEDIEGFRKSMVLSEFYDYADSLLSLDRNFWKDHIEKWGVLRVAPYGVIAVPDEKIISRNVEEKTTRLVGYVEEFKEKYSVTDDQEAIRKYKEEFDAKTADLEKISSEANLPGFIDNPPLTLDDQLKYETIELPGNIPLVASSFENMMASKVGLALGLNTIPESLLVYLPFLPSVMTEIGVAIPNEIIPFEKMQERLRKEVLSLNAYFSLGFETGRAEIVLAGRGNNQEELKNAVGWMNAVLYSPYLSTDNLPRMIDVINQSVLSYRNLMKSAYEESWVDFVSYGYRFQHNPVFMSADCFLTKIHHLERLKWQLTDPGNEDESKALIFLLDNMMSTGDATTRESVLKLLSSIEEISIEGDKPIMININGAEINLPGHSGQIAREIAASLKVTLGDVPDANLASDWVYLCRRIKDDLMMSPQTALDRINAILGLIRKTDNARMFMISNSQNRETVMPMLENLTGKLGNTPSIRQQYNPDMRIFGRLKDRFPDTGQPYFAGLVNEGTENGIIMFSTKIADSYDTSEAAILNCMSGKLYGGSGSHGIFMNTWAAGLAYSNGYSYRQNAGRLSYYAERCPDVAETMKFVAGFLKDSEPDSSYVDYCVAQIFSASRAQSRYEPRGEMMAGNLADGRTPEKIKAFRQKVLDIRKTDGLFEKLVSRMEQSYGPVLIGYGPPVTQSEEGFFLLIGPEPQFESLEKYIEQAEGEKHTVYRLYPRDFWLTI
jgi:Zn-dependent M16 (insulinase) family peptidase